MKNIDKDIEEFEQNLITIGMMSDQIVELKKSLKNLLDETTDIDELKKNIIKEIDNINKIYEENNKKINEQIDIIKNMIKDINASLGKDTEKIVNPVCEKIEETSTKNTTEINKLKNNFEKKESELEKFICKDNAIIKIGLIMNVILTIIVLILK